MRTVYFCTGKNSEFKCDLIQMFSENGNGGLYLRESYGLYKEISSDKC